MLTILSPAKRLDFDNPGQTSEYTQPHFLETADNLAKALSRYSTEELKDLMGVSPELAQLNFERFQEWETPFNPDDAKQALLAYKGDVYNGLKAENLSEKQLLFAQDHLRIISGLYGVVRPLDLIRPYRLEMSTPVPGSEDQKMDQFWKPEITQRIREELEEQNNPVLINLASKEYFDTIDTSQLPGKIVTPVFKELKGDKYKVIGIKAKKARGMMAAYIIRNGIERIEDLKGFEEDGYHFNENMSDDNELVFTREQG